MTGVRPAPGRSAARDWPVVDDRAISEPRLRSTFTLAEVGERRFSHATVRASAASYGTSVDQTAAVAGVPSVQAFLVADTDLPPDGQVVASNVPVAVRISDVVTVAGRLEQVDAAALARYGIADPHVHGASGGVVVVATSVRRYLPESTAATPTPTRPAATGSPSGSPW